MSGAGRARFSAKHFGLPLASQLAAHAFAVAFVATGALVLLADRGALSPGLARLLRPVIPPRYRAVSATPVAATLLTSLKAGAPGVVTLESEQLSPPAP